MTKTTNTEVRVSTLIAAKPTLIVKSFSKPSRLKKFWLSHSSGPLTIGKAVLWKFKVKGAEAKTTATILDGAKRIAWDWADGTSVTIDLEVVQRGTMVHLTNRGFRGTAAQKTAAALVATEGFALVLADLKTLLETGRSAHIVRDKARLIELMAKRKK